MIKTREFPRVKLSTKIILSRNGTPHHGHLQNISKCGALVRLESGTHLPAAGDYVLSVYLDGEQVPLQFSAELVNITFGMAGIKFAACDGGTAARLDDLLKKLTLEVDVTMAEHERPSGRVPGNFQEG